MDKHYITADELLIDSFKLAQKICLSGFEPDLIIGIWRGGSPIAIAIHEFMDYIGITTDHMAIRTSSYYGVNKQHKDVEVYGLDYILNDIDKTKKLLLVDDVFDSGRSITAVIKTLERLASEHCPQTIKIACPWFKPARNTTTLKPDFFIHETDKWLVFPHELKGLNIEEIKRNKSDKLASMLDKVDRKQEQSD